jgi:indolepyruvate ferredoxin oxidoreductase beta subunit
MSTNLPERTLTILIAALGGEGGGVMADWLIDAASACGFPAQSTSIPGVAQRTGATTYYLEIYPAKRELLEGHEPVMALTPSPGNVDVMVSSEFVEAGRAMQNGFVSPEDGEDADGRRALRRDAGARSGTQARAEGRTV